MRVGELIKELERSGLGNRAGEKVCEDLQPDTRTQGYSVIILERIPNEIL